MGGDLTDQAVARLDVLRARRIGQMLVTTDAPDFDADPNTSLLDVATLDGSELLAQFKARYARYGTVPFDATGEHLRLYGGCVTIWSGFPGAGKCLGLGTPVLMADGTVKAVEHIAVDDRLMGPDSKPRRVRSLARGRERLYRIVPTKGDPYVVNESHVLSLKMSGQRIYGDTERVINISVKDYLGRAKSFRERAKGWRTGVDWGWRAVPLDPYFLGTWLGDGSIHEVIVYKPDEPVLEACESVASEHGLRAVRFLSNTCPSIRLSGTKGRCNPVYFKLRQLGVTERKHVPLIYRANSRHIRLQVLAGLIDTDGSLSRGGFDFSSISQELACDVVFLARSVGLAAYIAPCRKGCQTGAIGNYFRVSISGDCSIIPTRILRKQAPVRRQIKRVLVHGIRVEPLSEGDYYGFEIDGDGLFMLGDFTVTHNTTLLRQLICHELYHGSSVFLATLEEDPRAALVRLACTAAGCGPDDLTAHQMQWFIDAYGERFRIWGMVGIAQHRRLLAVARMLARQKIRHVVIDSLMCLDIRNDDLEAQRCFANLVAATAHAENIHIHLVAHPRKPQSAEHDLDIHDVAGTRELVGVVDNVLFVRRAQTPVSDPHATYTPMRISTCKQRHFSGWIGDIVGWYHRELRQFHAEQFPTGPIRYLPDDAYVTRTTAGHA
jgi:hypothetical protein